MEFDALVPMLCDIYINSTAGLYMEDLPKANIGPLYYTHPLSHERFQRETQHLIIWGGSYS